MRVFIAIPLPANIKADLAQLREVLRTLRLEGAWIRASNLHITLKFLGEVESERLDRIAAAMACAVRGRESFPLSLAGMGVFPNEINPRILWVGIEDRTSRLQQLYQAIESALVRHGFPPDVRPFVPHLTIARLAPASRRYTLNECLAAYRGVEIGRFGVDRLELLESRLRPSGAEYAVVTVMGLVHDKEKSTQ